MNIMPEDVRCVYLGYTCWAGLWRGFDCYAVHVGRRNACLRFREKNTLKSKIL